MTFKRLGDLCVGFDYGLQANPSPSGPAKLIRTADIGRDRKMLDLAQAAYVPADSKAPPRVPLRTGDIVIARNGEGSIGNAAIVPDGAPLAFHNHNLIRIRPIAAELSEWLVEFMHSSRWRDLIDEHSAGAAIRSITAARLKSFMTPVVPPDGSLPMLRQFHEYSSHAHRTLFQIQNAREQIREACDAGHLAAITGNLNDLPVVANLAASATDNASGADDSEGHPRDSAIPLALREAPWPVPSNWKWSTVGQEFRFRNKARRPLSRALRALSTGPHPYFGASGIIDYVDFKTHAGAHLLVSEDGSNLRSRRTPIAMPVNGEFAVNNHAHALKAKGSLNLEFAALMINSTDVSNLLTGVAQPKLGQARLKDLPIPVPPMGEQIELVNRWGAYYRSALAATLSTVRAEVALLQSIEAKRELFLDQAGNRLELDDLTGWSAELEDRRKDAEEEFRNLRMRLRAEPDREPTSLPASLADAIKASGSASAEELLAAMRWDETFIDQFYVELKELVRANLVSIEPKTHTIIWGVR